MALTPDKTRVEFGLTINEKIIPWGAAWPRTVYGSNGAVRFAKGTKYKADQLLSGGTGKPAGVTIHNTDGNANAETYTRATWPNGNMNDVRVHYYVDDVEAWQNLKESEVGWHAADGNGAGNTTTIAIEIIMNGAAVADSAKAEDNGAKLAAILLHKYGLPMEKLYTHKHWCGKQCPLYILPHWNGFVERVKKYLSELSGTTHTPEGAGSTPHIATGDYVTITNGAVYGGLSAARGRAIPTEQCAPKQHKVAALAENAGQAEAKLAEINSWVPLRYLNKCVPAKPGTTPEGSYTSIAGETALTARQMRAFLERKNPQAIPAFGNLPEIYIAEGVAEGIRGDVAFAQSLVETGFFRFGGDVSPEQNNFCGLGATGNSMPGNSFSNVQTGIRAQIQHLKAYATTEPLNGACADPRFQYVERGCAPYVEWLGIPDNPKGKGWAAGQGYGAAILALLKDMAKEVPTPVQPPQQARAVTLEEAAKILKKAGISSIQF